MAPYFSAELTAGTARICRLICRSLSRASRQAVDAPIDFYVGLELLARSGYEPVRSELGAAGLAVPVAH